MSLKLTIEIDFKYLNIQIFKFLFGGNWKWIVETHFQIFEYFKK